MSERWLTCSEIAELFHISVRTARTWGRGITYDQGRTVPLKNGFPAARKIGRKLLFKESEVQRWADRVDRVRKGEVSK